MGSLTSHVARLFSSVRECESGILRTLVVSQARGESRAGSMWRRGEPSLTVRRSLGCLASASIDWQGDSVRIDAVEARAFWEWRNAVPEWSCVIIPSDGEFLLLRSDRAALGSTSQGKAFQFEQGPQSTHLTLSSTQARVRSLSLLSSSSSSVGT